MERKLTLPILLLLAALGTSISQTHGQKMKLNAGIVTSKIKETKDFYVNTFGFGVTFENEFYLLLHTPNKEAEISFLLPNHKSQHPLFRPAFGGKGVYLTIEVENVDKEYQRISEKKIPIQLELKNEPWGDRHFVVVDPNGIGIDIVTHIAN
jgi:uncharacterized glyoxalase superfamily protein PhnB